MRFAFSPCFGVYCSFLQWCILMHCVSNSIKESWPKGKKGWLGGWGEGSDGWERWRSRVEITEAGASSGFLPLALGGPAVHKGKLFKYILSLSFIHLIRHKGLLSCFFLIDFPESEKLTLFIANMWHDIFISQSVINKAMQLVARQRAKGEVLNCLRAFLNWEKVRFLFL